jgi:hypothetical protein
MRSGHELDGMGLPKAAILGWLTGLRSYGPLWPWATVRPFLSAASTRVTPCSSQLTPILTLFIFDTKKRWTYDYYLVEGDRTRINYSVLCCSS